MKGRDILLFNTTDKAIKISVHFDKGTFWLTQKAMGELFGVNVPAISKHIKNIFETNELDKNSVISKMETTALDGKKYNTLFYRLEAILAVGYRVSNTFWQGSISMLETKLKSGTEYEVFRIVQDQNYMSDFDRMIAELEK